jgi:hypothetical protein
MKNHEKASSEFLEVLGKTESTVLVNLFQQRLHNFKVELDKVSLEVGAIRPSHELELIHLAKDSFTPLEILRKQIHLLLNDESEETLNMKRKIAAFNGLYDQKGQPSTEIDIPHVTNFLNEKKVFQQSRPSRSPSPTPEALDSPNSSTPSTDASELDK